MEISGIILAKNEAATIAKCILSLKPLNPEDILVIDDESTDETSATAEFHGATVYRHHKRDFSEARNFGLRKARSTYVLYVDADESLSPGLVDQIKNTLPQTKEIAAYSLPRINFYLGTQWLQTERVIRLFRKDALQGWRGELHESPLFRGKLLELDSPILHYTHRTLTEMVENTIVWSKIEANLRFQTRHPQVSWWRIPRVMLPTFWDYYIRQGGWRVGAVGLIESIYQAFSMFITYARLWEMQKKLV